MRPELVPDASAFTELDILHQRTKALMERIDRDVVLHDNPNEYVVTRYLYDAANNLRSALEAWGP